MTKSLKTPDSWWFQYRLTTICWLILVVASFFSGLRWGVIDSRQSGRQSTRNVKVNDMLHVVFNGKTANPPTAAPEQQAMRSGDTQRRFNVAVVDLRPDGGLVLQGVGTTLLGNNIVQYEFSGVTQLESIRPDNTVVSEHVADLRLTTRSHERK
jgi:flagellar basal body L-ring protein FlgH